ncbi:arylsulfatase [Sphingomonas sp. NIBR02145]|uniref:arylsulfatase n=1 Tax=Sphingomonas sp. NIBR02145 TaxID=3014784 RepID=UPI0022B42DBA|nr:arylsulfatase [Sphingomonas sp. NIBR02145]WHU01418.1 arylsulfatase [Sphingomonas sp. NIBR02145]
MKSSRRQLIGALLANSALAAATPGQASKRKPPNIVLIVLDDTGYSDFGCFGSEIRTPNIDALAADGLRFNHFESKAICTATRAALLTGRNNHSLGLADLPSGKFQPPGTGKDAGDLAANVQLLPEALRARGYATMAIGKWHLATEFQDGSPGNNASWPRQRGFDYYYGFISGWADQLRPDLVENNARIGKPSDPNYHFSADITDRAIARLAESKAASPGKPRFLYLAFGATHAPIQVPRPYIDAYAGQYDKGWDAIRAARFARQKTMGIVPPGTTLPPANSGDDAWEPLDPVKKRVYARFMEAYAGFLTHTDEQIGRLVAALKASGDYDNTVFVLLSDNGASAEHGQTGSIGQLYPPAHLDAAELATHMQDIGTAQIGMQRPWGMASNTPFRRYKSWPNAGGVRTPLIVSWPGHLPNKGAIRRQRIDAVDIAPTLVELAGARFDAVVDGTPMIPVAGASFRNALFSASAPDPRPVQFFELRGNRAVRAGKWRAVAIHKLGTPFEQDHWALYDTEADFAEAEDLSGRNPNKVSELKAIWQREASRYGALPLSEGPDYVRKLDRYRDAFLKD